MEPWQLRAGPTDLPHAQSSPPENSNPMQRLSMRRLDCPAGGRETGEGTILKNEGKTAAVEQNFKLARSSQKSKKLKSTDSLNNKGKVGKTKFQLL